MSDRPRQYPIRLPRETITRLRASPIHGVNICRWQKAFADDDWMPNFRCYDLADDLGIYNSSFVERLTSIKPEQVWMLMRGKKSACGGTGHRIVDVAYALLLLERLGARIPVAEMITPLQARLRKQRHFSDRELTVVWASYRVERPGCFVWPPMEELAEEIGSCISTGVPPVWPDELIVTKLFDGRIAIAFRDGKSCGRELVLSIGKRSPSISRLGNTLLASGISGRDYGAWIATGRELLCGNNSGG
jgi:hypothetical protein